MTNILTTVDIVNFIPWGFTLLSILITVYTMVKKGTKEDTATTATVITKLENIQRTVDKTGDIVTTIQDDIKKIDKRVTVLETKMKIEMSMEG